jgi:hypothetical protein
MKFHGLFGFLADFFQFHDLFPFRRFRPVFVLHKRWTKKDGMEKGTNGARGSVVGREGKARQVTNRLLVYGLA